MGGLAGRPLRSFVSLFGKKLQAPIPPDLALAPMIGRATEASFIELSTYYVDDDSQKLRHKRAVRCVRVASSPLRNSRKRNPGEDSHVDGRASSLESVPIGG